LLSTLSNDTRREEVLDHHTESVPRHSAGE
jgi:hypothetical protein